MRTQRRAWSPSIPLTFLTVLAVATPLTGCQKAQELADQVTGEDEKPAEEKAPEVEAPAEDEVPKSAEAKVELEEAEEAGLPQAAIVLPKVEAKPMTSLDDLLGLVPKDGKTDIVAVVRDASVFLDYIDESANFVTGPIARLGLASAGNPELADMAAQAAGQLPMMKAEYDKAKATIEASGVHLDKGIVVVGSDDGPSALIYSGDKPEALSELVKTLGGGADEDKLKCKAIETAVGYIVCTEEQAELDAYLPGGTEGAAALRARLATALPGVDFEASNIIIDVPGEDAHVAIETPPGMMVVSAALPMEGDPELAEMGKTLAPSPAKLLRAVQPGAGFVWANIAPQVIADEVVADMANDPDAPASVKNLLSSFSGEVLLSGHYTPAAVALQFGLEDDAAWPEVAAELGGELDKVKGDMQQELAVPGGEWDIGMVDIPVGGETVSAFHAGLSGVPEADVLAQYTGLTIDGWAFAANDAIHFALGATPEAIGTIAAAEAAHEAASDGLKVYLPQALSSALEADQVSMIAHLPLDALHSPQTHELIKAALKNVEEFEPDLALAILDLSAVLSSYTMWVTHSDGKPQIHFAVQAFGHLADDEGKAALAAAAAVASGASPADAYGGLVSTYPTSPRLAAYKARAGEAQSGLVASGFGALFAAGALAYPVIEGNRNEEMIEELAIEEDAAEKAKEESKDAKPKSTPQPTPKPKEDPKPADEPTIAPEDPKPSDDSPAPVPDAPPVNPDTAPPAEPSEDAAPKPPPIIPDDSKAPSRSKGR